MLMIAFVIPDTHQSSGRNYYGEIVDKIASSEFIIF